MMDAPCECAMEGGTPVNVDRCDDKNEGRFTCTRPVGHDGPHTSCSVIEHPVEVWK